MCDENVLIVNSRLGIFAGKSVMQIAHLLGWRGAPVSPDDELYSDEWDDALVYLLSLFPFEGKHFFLNDDGDLILGYEEFNDDCE